MSRLPWNRTPLILNDAEGTSVVPIFVFTNVLYVAPNIPEMPINTGIIQGATLEKTLHPHFWQSQKNIKIFCFFGFAPAY